MNKNPLLVLLGISALCFFVFLLFVYFVLLFVIDKDGATFSALSSGSRVGVVKVSGVILDGEKIIKQLKKFHKDESIRGIILRVNSPGGAIAPSQEIHDFVRKVAQDKPVVASFATVAASGGYYISASATKIIANPGTVTGSIGVISQYMNLKNLYQWAKMDPYTIKSGKFKAIGSPSRPMTPEERALVQTLINELHLQFVGVVAKGRNMSLNKVKKLADGRVYSGAQALSNKLIDGLGGMEVAVEEMKKLAKIEGEVNLIYPKKKRRGLFANLGLSSQGDELVKKLSAVMGGLDFSRLQVYSHFPALLYLLPGYSD